MSDKLENKITIMIQTRIGSKRLPTKILKKICEKTILNLIFERLQNVNDAKTFLITGSMKMNTTDYEVNLLCKKN